MTKNDQDIHDEQLNISALDPKFSIQHCFKYWYLEWDFAASKLGKLEFRLFYMAHFGCFILSIVVVHQEVSTWNLIVCVV